MQVPADVSLGILSFGKIVICFLEIVIYLDFGSCNLEFLWNL